MAEVGPARAGHLAVAGAGAGWDLHEAGRDAGPHLPGPQRPLPPGGVAARAIDQSDQADAACPAIAKPVPNAFRALSPAVSRGDAAQPKHLLLQIGKVYFTPT